MDFFATTLVERMGMPENYSEHGGSVDHMTDVLHWFMLVLFVGWTTFFLIACWKFWRRRNPRASYHGVENHVTTHLEIAVVIFEAVLLLGFAFPLWAERTDRFEDIQAQDPVRVRVWDGDAIWRGVHARCSASQGSEYRQAVLMSILRGFLASAFGSVTFKTPSQ